MYHGRKCRSICTISSRLEEYLRKDKDAGKMHEEADGNGRGVLRNGAAGGSPSKSGRSR